MKLLITEELALALFIYQKYRYNIEVLKKRLRIDYDLSARRLSLINSLVNSSYLESFGI